MADFRKIYATYHEKDLDRDEFMVFDALDVFGRTSAEKTIGYGMDVILDLAQSCKPLLRRGERKLRSSSRCASCQHPLFRSPESHADGIGEDKGEEVSICDVCNEWVHVGDPTRPDSCYAKHLTSHMVGCVCLGLRARARCRESERPSCRPREAALKAWEILRDKRLNTAKRVRRMPL